jgi:hypothetical protein
MLASGRMLMENMGLEDLEHAFEDSSNTSSDTFESVYADEEYENEEGIRDSLHTPMPNGKIDLDSLSFTDFQIPEEMESNESFLYDRM